MKNRWCENHVQYLRQIFSLPPSPQLHLQQSHLTVITAKIFDIILDRIARNNCVT